jgi:hypothetical protein
LLASPRLPSLLLKARVDISQQGTLYIFLDAHLTNSTLPFSHTFSLPILHHSLNPDNKTTHGTFVPKKSARLPSDECATGPSIEEQSPASETVFSAMLPIFRGGFRGSNTKLQRSPCPSEILTSSMALQDCHSSVLTACLAPEGGGCGAWNTSVCKES